ncbi:MAG: hypothetical protein L3J43_10015 [Sulfurovum sp.]|nr:hypothetical protein [Sulfurovum sp.]
MKKVEVVKNTQVEVKPFVLRNFIQSKEMPATIKHTTITKVTKKELKNVADSLGLPYEDAQISFCKKLLNEYLKQMSEK